MALVKKSFPIVLAVLATLLIINTAIATILPVSSYDTPGNNGSIRDGSIGIDYAIYDTANLTEGTDEQQIFGAMTDTKYVYAYQLTNYDNVDDISIFSLSFLGSDAIEGTDRISSAEDWLGDPGDQNDRGVDSSGNEYGDEYYEGENTGFGFASWMFGGNGSIFDPGDHSYWLIIQSDNAPMVGMYSFEEIEGSPDVIVDSDSDQRPDLVNVPEPVTIALLSIGGLILRKTGKKA